MPAIKKSSNYPLERDCSICKVLLKTPVNVAKYDMPLRVVGRTTWGYVCEEHVAEYAAPGAWSLGTQIAGDLD
jgi:hypothetical protein